MQTESIRPLETIWMSDIVLQKYADFSSFQKFVLVC